LQQFFKNSTYYGYGFAFENRYLFLSRCFSAGYILP